MMDICLVSMPYSDIPRPSLALGLLQAVLQRDGLRVETIYANLLFAEEIGLHQYGLAAKCRPEDGLGEWTFGQIAFPDFEPDHDAYIDRLIQRNRLLRKYDAQQLKEALFLIRKKAEGFLSNLTEQMLDRRPGIVGCSSTFQQHVSSLALLRRIHELAPEVITMLGGANCETVMGLTTHKSFPWVDYVVSGEADGLIVKLCRNILEHGREIAADTLPWGVFGPAHRVDGYPRSKGKAFDNAPRAITCSLDGLPVPNYDDYFEALKHSPFLREKVRPGLTVETSRGCWWGQEKGCTFCGLNGKGKVFRSKPHLEVLRELDTLCKRYGVNRFETTDNIMDMGYFETLLPELKRAGSPYRIFYETRSTLTRNQVKALREAGVIWIQPGIESLHTKVLALINKGCQAWKNIQLLKWCRQFGIRAGWNLLCDFPGEEDGWYMEMAEMLPLLTHLQPPGCIFHLRFDRYSRYHSQAGDYGLRLRSAELYPYIYPLTGEDLSNQVYFFEDEERSQVGRSPLLAALLARPGIEAVRREGIEWLLAFWSDARPALTMRVSPSTIHIRDTRPVAAASSHTLTGIEREIYLACDEAPLAYRLHERFNERGVARSQVETALQGLLERKLLMAIDDRLLALAVKEPVMELPDSNEFPGGLIDRQWLEDADAAAIT